MNDDQDYNQFFHGYRAPAPVYNPPPIGEKVDDLEKLQKELKEMQQEVAMLKMTLKNLMDAISRHDTSNHPLYRDVK